jgi:hypothetical protein
MTEVPTLGDLRELPNMQASKKIGKAILKPLMTAPYAVDSC